MVGKTLMCPALMFKTFKTDKNFRVARLTDIPELLDLWTLKSSGTDRDFRNAGLMDIPELLD